MWVGLTPSVKGLNRTERQTFLQTGGNHPAHGPGLGPPAVLPQPRADTGALPGLRLRALRPGPRRPPSRASCLPAAGLEPLSCHTHGRELLTLHVETSFSGEPGLYSPYLTRYTNMNPVWIIELNVMIETNQVPRRRRWKIFIIFE